MNGNLHELSRTRALRTVLLTSCMLLALAGCGGSSDNGNGDDETTGNGPSETDPPGDSDSPGDSDPPDDDPPNDDPPGDDDPSDPPDVGATECNATLSTADAGGGLTTDAGVDTLQFFVFDTELCAFDPQSGVLFSVDDGLESASSTTAGNEIAVPASLSGTRIDRVIYTANNRIRAARTDHSSAAPPAPETISSEAEAGAIEEMMLAPDLQQAGAGGLAYRKARSGAPDEWFSVRVGASATDAPLPFTPLSRPIAPVIDPATDRFDGWLVLEPEGDPQTITVARYDTDLNLVATLLENDDTTPGIDTHLRTWLDDGSLIIGIDDFYFHYEPQAGSAGTLNTLGEIEERRGIDGFASDGSALYLALRSSTSSQVWRVDAGGVDMIDQVTPSGDANTRPSFVTIADDRAVWGWNTTGSVGGPSGVRSVPTTGGTAQTLASYDETREVRSRIHGSAGGWVYYRTQQQTGALGWEAHAVQADGSQAVEFVNHQWAGASTGTDAAPLIAQAPPRSVSEVFLIEAQPGFGQLDDQTLKGLSATAPTATPVEFGALARTGAPLPEMTDLGFGPHRLLRPGGDDVYYVDTRAHGSARALITDPEEFMNRFRLIPGF